MSIENAVALCEHLQEETWTMFLGVCGADGIEAMRAKMKEALTSARDKCNDPARMELMTKGIEEMDDPAFLRYLYNKIMAL